MDKSFRAHPLPLLLIAGLALYFANSMLLPGKQSLLLDSALIEETFSRQQRQQTQPLSQPQKQQLIAQLIEDQILVQQALEQNLDRLAPVQSRMQQLTELVNDPQTGLTTALPESVAEQLIASDGTIRNYLIGAIEAQIRHQIKPFKPSEQQIKHHYQQYPERYTSATRYHLSHLFIANTTNAVQRAKQLQLTLTANETEPAEAISQGDVFFSGHHLQGKTAEQVMSSLGLSDLPPLTPSQWSQPLPSAYGWHLIWLHKATPKQKIPLHQATARIDKTLRQKHQQEELRAQITQLLKNYQIQLPEPYQDYQPQSGDLQ